MSNNGLRRRSPAADACRRIAFSDSGAESHYSAKRTISTRRKRLELRRLRSSSSRETRTETDPKRRRFGNESEDFDEENRASEMSLSYPSSSDRSSENDVISSRSSEARGESRTTRLGHGAISLIGRRREMEDAVAVELGFLNKGDSAVGFYDFYGVYDGHGGSCVAHACRDRLHRLLVEEIKEEGGGLLSGTTTSDWEKVMVGCFWKMDEEVNGSRGRALVGAEEEENSAGTVGSTAVVAVVGEEEVVVANCGDSRAVMSSGGVVVSLSSDHKPDRPDELERIEGAGGRVINWNGNRVLGVLATSRSIGDHYLKPFVIPKPEVKVIKRNSEDEFLILATDGLWDVVSNEFACHVVKRCLEGRTKRKFQAFGNGSKFNEGVKGNRAAEAAALLAELAMARGSYDNISVVVVELNHPVKQKF